MADIDWTKWLPPAELPDTGPKTLRPGQIWAWRPPTTTGYAAVARIEGRSDRGWETTRFASNSGQTPRRSDVGDDSPALAHAVLVQDVGQPEPTSPDDLYGRVCWWCRKRDTRDAVSHCSIQKQFHSRCWDLWQRAGYPQTAPAMEYEWKPRADVPEELARVLSGGPPAPTAGALLPGDVITAFGHGFKLLKREVSAEADREGRQQWHVKPLEPSVVGHVDHIRFATADVTKVVPGWRAGQRRQVTIQRGTELGRVVIGRLEDRLALALPATWLLRGERPYPDIWVDETWPSYLLEEAPAADLAAQQTVEERSQWHGWRAGQKRRVRAGGMVAVGYLRHSGNPEPDDWMLDPQRDYVPGTSTYVGASSIWSDLLEDVPAPTAHLRRPEPNEKAEAAMERYRKTLDDIVAVTIAHGGPVHKFKGPLLIEAPAPAPRREVSTNGREWVDYGTLDDPDPLTSYAHWRVVGPTGLVVGEKAAATCGEVGCSGGGTWRDRKIGGLHTRVIQCDRHYLKGETVVQARMGEMEVVSRSNRARMRMAAMDYNTAGLGASAAPASAHPMTFGGIWRTR